MRVKPKVAIYDNVSQKDLREFANEKKAASRHDGAA
jgi:hypothetical protein